jgi:mRNA interferase MazF
VAAYVPSRVDQAGHRPALVISPSSYNRRVGLAVCCPVTSQVKGYPFEVLLPTGLGVERAILSDQIKSLDWRVRQARRIARAPADVLGRACARNAPALAGDLARGELSYAKVRALTRVVATPETEARLLAVGRAGTATERQPCAARVPERGRHGGAPRPAGTGSGDAAPAGAAAREALYQRARAEAALTPPADPAAEPPTPAQQQADALALLAETALTTSSIPAPQASATRWWSTSTPRHWPIPISRVSPSLKRGLTFAETSRRLAWDARISYFWPEEERCLEPSDQMSLRQESSLAMAFSYR